MTNVLLHAQTITMNCRSLHGTSPFLPRSVSSFISLMNRDSGAKKI